MLNHLSIRQIRHRRAIARLKTRVNTLLPGHPDYLAPSLMIGVAWTSPAMTRFYVLIQNDRKPLDQAETAKVMELQRRNEFIS